MALTYTKTGTLNGDNLRVYYPPVTATETRGGAVNDLGGNVAEVWVTLADLPALSGDTNGLLLADNVRIPANAFITKVETFVSKETAGTNANFNLGIVKALDYTITDADGLLAAADIFNGGTDLGRVDEFVVGTTEAGSLIGTQLASTSLLCGSYDTGAFTAGILRVRVFWTPVLAADD